ncbi:MAG: glycosyltransferase family 2 protein [Ignavibacteriaceae bacterium]|jgi:glycosyltransferase involved in cell wall biosynthesis
MDNYLVPDITVILTTYNREKYIRRCIESIIGQKFKNWKLIAIDDGSEDGSLNILKDYELQYKNIEVLHQENRKLAISRNRGIRLTESKYLTFIDSDDEYAEDHLGKRIKFMEVNPHIDLIHGGTKIIGNEFVRDKDNPDKFIHLSECSIGGTFLGKTKIFKSLNGFRNISYSEDSDFLERAEKLFNVKKVSFDTYIYHRELEDSITNLYVP